MLTDQDQDFKWYHNNFECIDELKVINHANFNLFKLKILIHIFIYYDLIIVRGLSLNFVLVGLINNFYKLKIIAVELSFSEWKNNFYRQFLSLIIKKVINNYSLIHTYTNSLGNFIKQKFNYNNDLFIKGITFSYESNYKFKSRIISNETCRIVSVGRVNRSFNYVEDELIDTDWDLLIIGKKCTDNKNISYTKNLPYDKMLQEILISNLVILSLNNSNLPSGIRMFFICSLHKIPVIITDINGNSEYFSNHKYYKLISFNNIVGFLKNNLNNFLINYNKYSLVDYNYNFIINNFNAFDWILEFNANIKKIN